MFNGSFVRLVAPVAWSARCRHSYLGKSLYPLHWSPAVVAPICDRVVIRSPHGRPRARPAAAPRLRHQRRGADLLRCRHEGLDRRRDERHPIRNDDQILTSSPPLVSAGRYPSDGRRGQGASPKNPSRLRPPPKNFWRKPPLSTREQVPCRVCIWKGSCLGVVAHGAPCLAAHEAVNGTGVEPSSLQFALQLANFVGR